MIIYRLWYKHFLDLYLFTVLLGTALSTRTFPTKPAFNISDIPFDTKPDKRGNWCDIHKLVINGTLNLKEALKGQTISVVLPGKRSSLINYQDKDDLEINSNNPGLLINLLDEVATRGKFNWEFGVVHEYKPIFDKTEKNITELLIWIVDNFDVAADWWLQTPFRVEKGFIYPKGWYDGSIIVIDKKRKNGKSFSLFSWMRPFSKDVWILLIVTLLLSGILCHALEVGFKMPKRNLNELSRFCVDFTDHIYMSMMVFTGQLNLKTKTKPGQLVTFSISMFAMLMLSTYTANLASFLVTKNSQQIEISVHDIVKQKKSMCIVKAAKWEVIKSEYPNAIFKIKSTEKEVYEGLNNNECHYAIASADGWNEIKDKEGYNWGCKMERVDSPGSEYRRFEAGFTMKSDSGEKCTSLLREVFHFHLLEMESTSDIEVLWEKHRTDNQDRNHCSVDESMDDLQTLDLYNMGGIFFFHFALLAIAIVCTIGGKCYNRVQRQPYLVNNNLAENCDYNQTGHDRFYSFTNGSTRSSVLKEFPINSYVPNQEILGNAYNKTGTDVATVLYSDEKKQIDEVASDIMKLVCQRLDKMAPSHDEIRNDSNEIMKNQTKIK